MENYTLPIQIRWADIDANQHLRHSAYYDYGATIRMNFLAAHGLSVDTMGVFKIGPVIFREEALFKREIKFEDKIVLDAVLQKATHDFSRWTLLHHFYKEDQQVAATVTIDGAWIDLIKRKLAMPNETMVNAFASFPKASDFQWIEKNNKA